MKWFGAKSGLNNGLRKHFPMSFGGMSLLQVIVLLKNCLLVLQSWAFLQSGFLHVFL
jgi:hypothetical protein